MLSLHNGRCIVSCVHTIKSLSYINTKWTRRPSMLFFSPDCSSASVVNHLYARRNSGNDAVHCPPAGINCSGNSLRKGCVTHNRTLSLRIPGYNGTQYSDGSVAWTSVHPGCIFERRHAFVHRCRCRRSCSCRPIVYFAKCSNTYFSMTLLINS